MTSVFFFLVLDACFAGIAANKASTRQCLSRANPQQYFGEQCPKVLPWLREDFKGKGFLVPSVTATELISFELQNSLTGERHCLPSFALEEVQGTSKITAVAGWSQWFCQEQARAALGSRLLWGGGQSTLTQEYSKTVRNRSDLHYSS